MRFDERPVSAHARLGVPRGVYRGAEDVGVLLARPAEVGRLGQTTGVAKTWVQVLAVGLTAAGLAGLAGLLVAQNVPAANPIDTHPAPALFDAALIAPLGAQLAAEKQIADRLFKTWAAQHPGRDDKTFTGFAVAHLPPPPDAATQAGELTELHALADQRTKPGKQAATWLEVYGKTNIWTKYVTDANRSDSNPGELSELKDTTRLAKAIVVVAQTHFARPGPKVADPSLKPGSNRPEKLSYPSGHASYVFAELTVLSAQQPSRREEFLRTANEIAYSRLYAAGHYRSDLVTGALLGDLIGDYELSLHPVR